MRIWDLEPKYLCKSHLLGEHRELHALWNIISQNKMGYSKHPETVRWQGKLPALYARHDLIVKEMLRRGYNHMSPLPGNAGEGKRHQNVFINTPDEQRQLLNTKNCNCKFRRSGTKSFNCTHKRRFLVKNIILGNNLSAQRGKDAILIIVFNKLVIKSAARVLA